MLLRCLLKGGEESEVSFELVKGGLEVMGEWAVLIWGKSISLGFGSGTRCLGKDFKLVWGLVYFFFVIVFLFFKFYSFIFILFISLCKYSR